MNKETVDKVVAAATSLVKAAIKAAVAGAGVAFLTVVANAAPGFGADFDLNPAAVGQVTALVLLARDALKTKGG